MTSPNYEAVHQADSSYLLLLPNFAVGLWVLRPQLAYLYQNRMIGVVIVEKLVE
jgi:hypothetical protein